jgi:hypothetical protein
MERRLAIVMALAALLFATPLLASQAQPDPSDFALEATLDIRLLPNSLLLVVYADPGKEVGQRATLHRVYAILPAPSEPSYPAEDDVALTLYTTGDGSVSYVAGTHALFYGDQLEDDGFPGRIWEDPLEDGLNGNEIFIDRDVFLFSGLAQAGETSL